MGAEALRSELQSLERKVKLLLNEHSQLKSEVEILKSENVNLKSRLSSKDELLSNFQNQRQCQ